jgi:hypothetical protein
MACGVSTLAYCHEGNVNAIWDDFNNKGMSVADSFIDGLGSTTVKPLCITRGGADITKTPLYDATFTNRRNTSGTGYLHILYAGGTQTNPPAIKWTPDKIPVKLWRVRVVPPGDPVEFKRRLVTVKGVEQLRDAQIAGTVATVRRNPESGALHLRAITPTAAAVPRSLKTEKALQEGALAFVRKLGWVGADTGVVRVRRLLTASMPVNGKAADITRGEKGVIVTITRQLRVGGQTVDVLGQGGRIDVTLGRGGEVLTASRTWRKAEVSREAVAIKPFAKARAEAEHRLKKPEAYQLADWRFGYKEDAANVAQRELAVIYQFDFVPKDRAQLMDYPPRQVEISAEEQ